MGIGTSRSKFLIDDVIAYLLSDLNYLHIAYKGIT